LQHFEDRSTATPYHLYIGNSVSVVNLPPSSISQILFGGDKPDNLTGSDTFDKLYGGAGNDFLQGGKGDDDYLEGGYGEDIYNYRLGGGHGRQQPPGHPALWERWKRSYLRGAHTSAVSRGPVPIYSD